MVAALETGTELAPALRPIQLTGLAAISVRGPFCAPKKCIGVGPKATE